MIYLILSVVKLEDFMSCGSERTHFLVLIRVLKQSEIDQFKYIAFFPDTSIVLKARKVIKMSQ